MMIKSFTAESAVAALKKIRHEMGGDAIVLSTRQIKTRAGRPLVEITACLDNPTVMQASTVLASPAEVATGRLRGNARSRLRAEPAPELTARQPSEFGAKATHGSCDRSGPPPSLPDGNRVAPVFEQGGLQRADECHEEPVNQSLDGLLGRLGRSSLSPGVWGGIERIHTALSAGDFPDSYINEFLGRLLRRNDTSSNLEKHACAELARDLAAMMAPGLSFKPGDRILLVGPAGAGKSSVLGKLAVRLVLRERRKVRLISLDDQRIGAHEEIASYADALGVPFAPSHTSLTGRRESSDTIELVDSPGLPSDDEAYRSLKARVAASRPDCCLAVFSALTRSLDVALLSAKISAFNPSHLVLTMTDLSSCSGSLVTAARCLKVKVAFTTDAPSGRGEMGIPDPDVVAQAVLTRGVHHG